MVPKPSYMQGGGETSQDSAADETHATGQPADGGSSAGNRSAILRWAFLVLAILLYAVFRIVQSR